MMNGNIIHSFLLIGQSNAAGRGLQSLDLDIMKSS